MFKKYRDKNGREIYATEYAYEVIYKAQGFRDEKEDTERRSGSADNRVDNKSGKRGKSR